MKCTLCHALILSDLPLGGTHSVLTQVEEYQPEGGRYLVRYDNGQPDWVCLEQQRVDWSGGAYSLGCGALEGGSWMFCLRWLRRGHSNAHLVVPKGAVLASPMSRRLCRPPIPHPVLHAGAAVGPSAAAPKGDTPETVDIVCNSLRGTFYVKRGYIVLRDGSEMTPTGEGWVVGVGGGPAGQLGVGGGGQGVGADLLGSRMLKAVAAAGSHRSTPCGLSARLRSLAGPDAAPLAPSPAAEFERQAGRAAAKKWKTSLRVDKGGGVPGITVQVRQLYPTLCFVLSLQVSAGM